MEKSEQSSNKIILGSGKNNTKLNLETLGDVELKFISFGDTQYFAKILAKDQISDKEFVQEILYNQLIRPKIDLQSFKQLSDSDLIEIAKAFIKKEDNIFQYFNNTEKFFKDFRIAIKTYKEKQIERLPKKIDPIIKSIQESFKTFDKDYSSLIQPALGTKSYIEELIEGISTVDKRFQEIGEKLSESFKPIVERYQAIAHKIEESLKPQIDYWQKCIEDNKTVFEKSNRFWIDFEERYNFAQETAVRVLQKYKWFVTPSLPIDFVFEIIQSDKKKGRHDKVVNRVFINYFSSNNWKNLEEMVNGWKNNLLLKKRIKILKDCVRILKIAQKTGINGASVVLPTVITQVDGALTDYLVLKGIKWDCEYDDFIQKGKVRKVGRKSQFKKNKAEVLTPKLDELANDVFF